MSRKILLQTILKLTDKIKTGDANFMDVSAEYFKSTGDFMDDTQKAIALEEINKIAPDNVTTLEGVDAVETILPMRGPNVQKAGDMSDTPFTDTIRKENPDVEIRGDESFDELMEKLRASDQADMAKEEGIGSLFPKGERGEGFDIFNSKRDEAAEFVRKMRGAGIKNPDIRGVFKEFGDDIEGGKRAATTLARAADMKADTKIKQELLSELDEMKMDKGPRFFQEEYMGYDDFRSAEDAKKIEVNNAIVDDLEKMGVEDDTIMFIMGRAREINRKPFYTSGEDFVDIIKEELDFQGIDYDVEFYKNYFRELTGLMRKPEPRFMYGGTV
tara:strand:- start:812 stop:1798 length:987 start_codon:yes stop_codon:yes gene_type:complete